MRDEEEEEVECKRKEGFRLQWRKKTKNRRVRKSSRKMRGDGGKESKEKLEEMRAVMRGRRRVRVHVFCVLLLMCVCM